MKRVRHAMKEERLDAGVREQHLDPGHAAGGGIALLGGGEIFSDLSG